MERCFILLIDDDVRFYRSLKSMIEEAFFGKVGLDWYKEDGFAATMICTGYYLLTIIGSRVGEDSRLELIERIKTRCPEQSIFLVAGRGDPPVSEQQAQQAGVDRVLKKKDLTREAVLDILKPFLEPKRCPNARENHRHYSRLG